MDLHHYPRDGKGAEKYFIAVPSYGPVEGTFAYSLACAAHRLAEEGIVAEICFCLGCCHVDDARNAIVHKFLSTDCKFLVFIDADVSFEPETLLKLIRTEGDLVGGTYPFKKDEEGYPIQIYGESYADDETGLVPVAGLPTGFMKIARHVFPAIEPGCKKYQTHDRDTPTTEFFNRTAAEGRARIGGDINFCHKFTRAGGKIHLIPDMNLGHTGTKTWTGNFNVFQHMTVLGEEKALVKS